MKLTPHKVSHITDRLRIDSQTAWGLREDWLEMYSELAMLRKVVEAARALHDAGFGGDDLQDALVALDKGGVSDA